MESTQRASLIAQLQILKVLDPGNASDYDERIEILQSGYTIFYDQAIGVTEGEVPEELCRFVLDVLDMYRMIEDYKSNNVNDSTVSGHIRGHFRGFDGNNEGSYLGFAAFLIDTQGKFQEQQAYMSRNDHMNSHMPMVPTYRKMLSAWKALPDPYHLTQEGVMTLLNA